jgi:GR25 family glycosyltransferase involved in LPS biosynthesis
VREGEKFMLAMILEDSSDIFTEYGVLICEDDSVSKDAIQEKINEIKEKLERTRFEWQVNDVISQFPESWGIKLIPCSRVFI